MRPTNLENLFVKLLAQHEDLMAKAGFPQSWIDNDRDIIAYRNVLATRYGRLRTISAAQYAHLDEILGEVLGARPWLVWRTRRLAEAMRAWNSEAVVLTVKSLQNYVLRTLRETAGTKANVCYDPALGLWQWNAKKLGKPPKSVRPGVSL
jgi:hypothetical protein